MTCFWTAAATWSSVRVETPLASETSATWSVSGTGTPFDVLDLHGGRGEAGPAAVAAMLEQPEIPHYLLSLGLVKPRDVVERRLSVVDASRRNAVFVARIQNGPTYVVKQAVPRSAGTLQH